MPIPDEQAGPPEHHDDPLDHLAEKIFDICNRRLRGEIDADEWERLVEEATKK